MTKVQEVIQYYLDHIDLMHKEENYEELCDFIGTGICDGFCILSTDECEKKCPLFYSVYKYLAEPTNDNLNEVKMMGDSLGVKIHVIKTYIFYIIHLKNVFFIR